MKCKHGLTLLTCLACAPHRTRLDKPAMTLANIERFTARDGIKVVTAKAHPNQGKPCGVRMDKVSDRAIKGMQDNSTESRMERDGVEKVFNQIMARIGPKPYVRRK